MRFHAFGVLLAHGAGVALFAVLMTAAALACVGPIVGAMASAGAGAWERRRSRGGAAFVAPIRLAALERYWNAEQLLGRVRTPPEAFWQVSACEINRMAAELERLRLAVTGRRLDVLA